MRASTLFSYGWAFLLTSQERPSKQDEEFQFFSATRTHTITLESSYSDFHIRNKDLGDYPINEGVSLHNLSFSSFISLHSDETTKQQNENTKIQHTNSAQTGKGTQTCQQCEMVQQLRYGYCCTHVCLFVCVQHICDTTCVSQSIQKRTNSSKMRALIIVH